VKPVGAGHARERLDRGHEKLLMELLAIRLSEQKTLAKSLVMSGHPHGPLLHVVGHSQRLCGR